MTKYPLKGSRYVPLFIISVKNKQTMKLKSLFIAMLALLSLASCTNYGKKVKSGNVEVYYKDGAEKADAQKLADLFYEAVKAADPSNKDKKSFQLSKPGDTILLKMVVDKKKYAKLDDNESLYAVLYMVSDSIYNGKPVNLLLTDNRFKTFETLAYKEKTDTEELYGAKYTAGNITVYSVNMDSETAQGLADYLNDWLKPKTGIDFQIEKPENGFYTVSMLSTADKAETVRETSMEETASRISANVLNDAPLVFQLKGNKFRTVLRTYEYKTADYKIEASDTTAVQ